MKHGLMALALLCWLAGALPAEGKRVPLTIAELETVEGGDLFLGVNRDTQMMTVTRITPGDYEDIECYSVKVTTSVVRNKDITPNNPKDSMENIERKLKDGNDLVLSKQFPTGSANISPIVGTQVDVEGPVLRTDATQLVDVVTDPEAIKQKQDYGYNVHFLDPQVATNTLGCVGVQNKEDMEKIVASLKTDVASGSTKQKISVTAYSPKTPAPVSTPHESVSTSPTVPKNKNSSSSGTKTAAPTNHAAEAAAPPAQNTYPPKTNVTPNKAL